MSRIDDVLKLAEMIRKANKLPLTESDNIDEWIELQIEITKLSFTIIDSAYLVLKNEFILELADEVYLMKYKLEDLQ